jgi:hypothetical protein
LEGVVVVARSLLLNHLAADVVVAVARWVVPVEVERRVKDMPVEETVAAFAPVAVAV